MDSTKRDVLFSIISQKNINCIHHISPNHRYFIDGPLTVADINEILLVGGATRTPLVQRRLESELGMQPRAEVDPDLCVAMGAAIQGGVLTGEVKDIVLLDVLPLSLGLETRGGLYVKLIPRNSTIPLKNTMTFTTVVDNQQSVEIHILQGEREIASANRSLAKFELVGIPPAPRGVPQVDVSFEIDANGIVSVSAKDKMTGLEQALQITPSSGLSPDEIERLIIEAETSIDRDREERELINERNRLDSLIRNARRAMMEIGKSFELAEQQSINGVLSEADEMLKSQSISEIREQMAKVEAAANRITAAMLTMAAKNVFANTLTDRISPARSPSTRSSCGSCAHAASAGTVSR